MYICKSLVFSAKAFHDHERDQVAANVHSDKSTDTLGEVLWAIEDGKRITSLLNIRVGHALQSKVRILVEHQGLVAVLED